MTSFLDTLSLAVPGAAVVVPGVNSLAAVYWSWIPAALIFHVGADLKPGFLEA